MSKTVIYVAIAAVVVAGASAAIYLNSTTNVTVERNASTPSQTIVITKEERVRPPHGKFEDRPVLIFPGVNDKK